MKTPEELWEEFGHVADRVARQFCRGGTPDEYDEARAEASLALWESALAYDPSRVPGRSHFGAFAVQRVRWHLIAWRRRLAARLALSGAEETPEPPDHRHAAPGERAELAELAQRALARMDPLGRALVTLSARGVALDEAARRVELSLNQAKWVLIKARQAAAAPPPRRHGRPGDPSPLLRFWAEGGPRAEEVARRRRAAVGRRKAAERRARVAVGHVYVMAFYSADHAGRRLLGPYPSATEALRAQGASPVGSVRALGGVALGWPRLRRGEAAALAALCDGGPATLAEVAARLGGAYGYETLKAKVMALRRAGLAEGCGRSVRSGRSYPVIYRATAKALESRTRAAPWPPVYGPEALRLAEDGYEVVPGPGARPPRKWTAPAKRAS
jgi:DNA-directed RNA polymerase specialized sigma24 family protein